MVDGLEKEIGTVDTVMGVFAVASEKLTAKNPDTLGFSQHDLYNGFRRLKSETGDKALDYLDYRREGDAWCSKALHDLLFFSGWGGSIQETRVACRAGCKVYGPVARETIKKIENEYGSKTLAEITKMADLFLKYVEEGRSTENVRIPQ